MVLRLEFIAELRQITNHYSLKVFKITYLTFRILKALHSKLCVTLREKAIKNLTSGNRVRPKPVITTD